jgi:molybdenum cofactor cytidylyltransferase
MTKTTGAIVLAAGFSRRFGNQKLIQKLSNGNSVLKQTLERIQAAIPNIEIVTTSEISAYLTPQTCGITIFSNASQGIGATLAFGISRSNNWDGCIVCLADMPFIKTETYRSIDSSLQKGKIVTPWHKGKRGNPVGFGSQFFDELMALDGDTGANHIITNNADAVLSLDLSDPGILLDIDTQADLEKYKSLA